MIFRKEQPIPEEAVSLREQRAMLGDRLSFAASEAYKLLRTNPVSYTHLPSPRDA